MRILITGGCGFIGSNLAIFLKGKIKNIKIISIDRNKVTIEFLKTIKPELKAKNLLDMEYFLRKNVESTVELFMQEMKDKSV